MFIHFNLAPTSNYTLRYIRVDWPKVFEPGAGDSGVKSDLSQKDDAIVAFALSQLLSRLGRPTDASRLFAEASDMIKDAIADDQHDPDLLTRYRGIGDNTGPWRDISNDPFAHGPGDRW
jgi:hypothetical protein